LDNLKSRCEISKISDTKPLCYIVDDSKDNAILIGEYMATKGWDYKIELDSRVATDHLEVININHYGLIFIDIHMPYKNGVEVALDLTEKRKGNLPIVIITGHEPEEILCTIAKLLGAIAIVPRMKLAELDKIESTIKIHGHLHRVLRNGHSNNITKDALLVQ